MEPITQAATLTTSSATLSSGLPELDFLLGGGLRSGHTVLLAGPPGSGKAVLASQLAFSQAALGRRVLVATVTSEPHAKWIDSLRGFTFFSGAALGQEIFLISAQPWLRRGVRESRELLHTSVRERGATALIMEGLTELRDLWRDDSKLREFLSELGVGLASADCVGIFTSHAPTERILELPESTAMDAIVALGLQRHGMRRERRLEVLRLRGAQPVAGEHGFRITEAGVRILPRLETRVGDLELRTPGAPAAFGVPTLDRALGGGLAPGSSTVLAGGSGTGKSLLGACFAATGAAAGEPTLVVSFQSTAEALRARASAVGLSLDAAMTDGRVRFLYLPAVELDADEVAQAILAAAREQGSRRLLVDEVSPLVRAVLPPERRPDFFAALALALRRSSITSLFILGTAGNLELGEGPVAGLADNFALLRRVEHQGELRRTLALRKVETGPGDWSARELPLGDVALEINADALEAPAGGRKVA